MADYIDVHMFEAMDEPGTVYFSAEDGTVVPVKQIRCEEIGDGFETVWRIQRSDLERA